MRCRSKAYFVGGMNSIFFILHRTDFCTACIAEQALESLYNLHMNGSALAAISLFRPSDSTQYHTSAAYSFDCLNEDTDAQQLITAKYFFLRP